MAESNPHHRWIERLSDEDKSFLKRFLLASGSLKAVAEQYGISYPTVRLRLDRMIEKVKLYDSQQIESEFERQLRAMFIDGRIDHATMKVLLEEHQAERQRWRSNRESPANMQSVDGAEVADSYENEIAEPHS